MEASPSPAVMPRRRPSAVPTAPGAVTVTMTVETAAGLFSDDSTTFVACAAVDGIRSPVLTGPRTSVLDSAAQWVCRSTPFMSALCTPVVQLYSGETADVEDIAGTHAGAVGTAFLRAGVAGTTVECHAGADPVTTLPVRAVVRGHEPPERIVLRYWDGSRLKAPRARPVQGRSGETDSACGTAGATVADELTRSFHRRLTTVRKQWSSSPGRLHCSGDPRMGGRPRRINVYTDASTAPRSRSAAIGIVCPELSVVLSGVLSHTWAREDGDVGGAELSAVAAAAKLFGPFAEEIVIHTDSTTAVRLWRNPLRIPAAQVWLKDGVLSSQQAVEAYGTSLRVRWVKGHADSRGNLWADRAAKLSWRSAAWKEPEETRRAKLSRLGSEVAEVAGTAGNCDTADMLDAPDGQQPLRSA
jgi:ribonuclease HI